jgi:sterol carrier protein 2
LLDEVRQSPMIFDPVTKLQCCPTSDGAAAAILASGSFVKEHHLEIQAVEIAGMAMATDLPSRFQERTSGATLKGMRGWMTGAPLISMRGC